jgi:hypothetical protein
MVTCAGLSWTFLTTPADSGHCDSYVAPPRQLYARLQDVAGALLRDRVGAGRIEVGNVAMPVRAKSAGAVGRGKT